MTRSFLPSFLTLLLGTAAAAWAIQSGVQTELDEVPGIRATLDARTALETGKSFPDLTIVEERRSTKYPFLNKKLYLVHTTSTARENTVLRGDLDGDKSRADRHSLTRQKAKPLVERAEGAIRATVAKGDQTAEIIDRSAPPTVPFPWIPVLGAALLALVILASLKGKTSAAAGASVLCAGATAYATYELLGAATGLANAYLTNGGRNAPSMHLPALAIWATWAVTSVVFGGLATFLSTRYAERQLSEIRKHHGAYYAIAPAMTGLALLVGIPFLFGVGMSFFHHNHGEFRFVGLQNFVDILGKDSGSFEPSTLPYSMVMTVVWTATNVFFHLTLGLGLALLLKPMSSRISKIYRVLLIVPWAVPSYLTALIWRSMFDPDVGAINILLGLQGMSWMHKTSTAFLANLMTNIWLGVPFMMVVCLGALTSIPEDLYEAADVDGASKTQQFLQITLPLLKPALLPSVILGSIWTFNKFEVIYLVSEGRPDGATDILVTEAYRWAFERGLAQGGAYGYAAAYSVVIFVVLWVYGWMTSRVAQKAEEALR